MPRARRRSLRGDPRADARRSSPITSRRSRRRASSFASGAGARGGPHRHRDRAQPALALGDIQLTRRRPSGRCRQDHELQGDDAERRAQPRARARLHERVVDAQVRSHLRVRVPAAQPHGEAGLPAVHCAKPRPDASERSRSSTSRRATCSARSTSSPSRGRRRRGGSTRTTRSTSSRLRFGALEDGAMVFSSPTPAVEADARAAG